MTFLIFLLKADNKITVCESMERFSYRELTDMHFIYGYCNGNSVAAAREYRRRFPFRRVPSHRVFPRIHSNMADHGSFQRLRGQGRPLTDYNYENALNLIEETPQVGLRPLSRITGIPRSNVIKLLFLCCYNR